MSPVSPKPRIGLNCCPKCEAAFPTAAPEPGALLPCPICGHCLRVWFFAAGLQVFGQQSAERTIAVTAEKLALSAEKITPADGFAELGADSLDVAEILMEIEGELHISLTNEEAETVRTVGDVIRAVDTCLSEKND